MSALGGFDRHLWIFGILATCVNVAMWKERARLEIEARPELADGYGVILRGALFWLNVPWVVMGLGSTVGGVPSVWHFLRPRDGNPWVLAFFASVVALWILGTYWLFFKGGAETLVRHPGILRPAERFENPGAIKALWVSCLLAGIGGLVFLCIANVRIPPVR